METYAVQIETSSGSRFAMVPVFERDQYEELLLWKVQFDCR